MQGIEGGVVAVDIGGTFTDVAILFPDGLIRTAKALSTPPNYEKGVLAAIAAVLPADQPMPPVVVHGTTVATNAVLSGYGIGKAALITTEGFRDVLEIARGKRADADDINWDKPPPVVPRHRVLELDERTSADGKVLAIPAPEALAELAAAVAALEVEAVAVSLLNSYAQPANETLVASYLRDAGCARFVTASTELTQTSGEYERTSTAALNAVLLPVVHDYLSALQRALGGEHGPSLFVMNSNGGLLPSGLAARNPVALVESGPAAGVLGAADTAVRSSLRNVIAFDMGGTTAKACLVEDGNPREAADYEVGGEINNADRVHRGGGYTISLPCFEISEIGAGGGSIAWIDSGGALRVGPQSAGASPGPACYGLGGVEPTVTDANLFLGYLPAGQLDSGINLDVDASATAIARIADPLGLGLEDAALAIRAVANASMVRALRSVSVERGRDPSQYAMVVFGGAGPSHAVSLAQELGVRRVVVPAAAGVFSAMGMLSANLRRDRVTSVAWNLRETQSAVIDAEFERLTAEVRAELESSGVDLDAAVAERHVEMMYSSQLWRISVKVDDPIDIATVLRRFEHEFRTLHGHVPDESPSIVTARVSLVVPLGSAQQHIEPPPRVTGTTRRAYFGGGGAVEVEVVSSRQALAESKAGPFVLEEGDSSVLVPPGCTAQLHDEGLVVIEVGDATTGVVLSRPAVALELVRHKLESIADEMALTVFSTSRSLMVQNWDFAAAIGTPGGVLAARGVGPGLHVATLPTAVRALEAAYPDGLEPGDVVVLNDPYQGGTHLPDIVMIAPLHTEADEMIGYSFSIAHHSDVGGGTPGSHAAGYEDLFQEGTIIPPVRLMRRGEIDHDIWRMILRNTRTPTDVAGDLQAQLAAHNVARRHLRAMAAEMGVDNLISSMGELLDYAERRTRAAIQQLPDGHYAATDYIDTDGVTGHRVTLSVDLEIRDSKMTADFSQSSPQVRNGINCNWSVVASAVYDTVRLVIEQGIPHNAGFERCFDIRTAPGTILDPKFPAPVASRAVPWHRLHDVMGRALADACPGRMWAAGEGGVSLVTFGGHRGSESWVLIDMVGSGTGARPGKDGIEGASWGVNIPIEDIERRYPIRIRQYGYVPGTGGRGKFRGTNAVVREWELLDERARVYVRNDRRVHRPFGLAGGEPGAGSQAEVLRVGSDVWERLPSSFSTFDMLRGDRLRIQAAGGGGYGNPSERPAELQARDVMEDRV